VGTPARRGLAHRLFVRHSLAGYQTGNKNHLEVATRCRLGHSLLDSIPAGPADRRSGWDAALLRSLSDRVVSPVFVPNILAADHFPMTPAEPNPTTAPPSVLAAAVALTIAGSDPSGGAGLQADLKTFQQCGVYGMSVVTLLTVQNTQAVTDVQLLSPDLIQRQWTAVASDIPPHAIKTGALGSAEIIAQVAAGLRETAVSTPVVVDPVLVSKHGHRLANEDVVAAYRTELLPRAWFVTPNRFELQSLTGCDLSDPQSLRSGIDELHNLGTANVLIKLGPVDGVSRHLLSVAGQLTTIDRPLVARPNNHGAGCVLSALLTAALAVTQARSEPQDVVALVQAAIEQTWRAVKHPSSLGNGISPAETRCLRPLQ
jgi:hydroxymethylpyrimidine/phosphomethylpyrimidine kinase